MVVKDENFDKTLKLFLKIGLDEQTVVSFHRRRYYFPSSTSASKPPLLEQLPDSPIVLCKALANKPPSCSLLGRKLNHNHRRLQPSNDTCKGTTAYPPFRASPQCPCMRILRFVAPVTSFQSFIAFDSSRTDKDRLQSTQR